MRALSEGLRREVKPYNIRTTAISPGAVTTELLEHIGEEDIQAEAKEFVSKIAVGADTFARMVAFAVNEPDDVDVNEILFRPTASRSDVKGAQIRALSQERQPSNRARSAPA